jgi:hypothetical protein
MHPSLQSRLPELGDRYAPRATVLRAATLAIERSARTQAELRAEQAVCAAYMLLLYVYKLSIIRLVLYLWSSEATKWVGILTGTCIYRQCQCVHMSV